MSKKNEKTIRQRVDELTGDYQVPKELHSKCIVAIMELIERAKSPEMFCIKCDTRMSIDLESGSLHCFNCGARKKIELKIEPPKIPPIVALKQRTEAEPNATPPDPRLLQAIDKAEENFAPRTTDPTKKGKAIQNIAKSRGGAKITKEDDDYIKGNVPGAKNAKVNWC